jgi:UDP-N-acetylmuramyl pentapeptide phosphotransferase/UDP-N-acetylglucosamine-1-phosphate transferase
VRLFIFCLMAAISAALVAWMSRVGVLDVPGHRSSHTRPIPKGGGIGIVAANLVWLLATPGPPMTRWLFGMGGLLVATIGQWDDRRSFPPFVKLAVQLVAAVLPVLGGLTPHVTGLFWFDALCAVGWVLLVTNAVNFMDGLNGLSSGVTAIAATISGPGYLTGGLVAGILGFLPFNYPRARIFMGDVGSQFCGYALAVLALLLWPGAHPWLVPFALAGMLADVIFTLIRRAINGNRLTQAHRSHLYQIAQRSGVPDWLVSAIHWGFAAFGAGLGSLPFRPWLCAVVLAPQICWGIYVVTRSQRFPVGPW